jgi:hypothetical protein
MGIINNDVYECSNGVQKAGTYISFATETIYLVQNYSGMNTLSSERNYNARANYRIFWDQAAREAGKSFIDLKSVNVTLTVEQLDSNIYQIMYDELKKIYPNASDELRTVVPVESAPVVPVADAPAESAPVADAPAESAPVADAPAESAPVADAPAESAPVADAPAESAPVADAPAESAPVADAPAESAPVDPSN